MSESGILVCVRYQCLCQVSVSGVRCQVSGISVSVRYQCQYQGQYQVSVSASGISVRYQRHVSVSGSSVRYHCQVSPPEPCLDHNHAHLPKFLPSLGLPERVCKCVELTKYLCFSRSIPPTHKGVDQTTTSNGTFCLISSMLIGI